MKNLAKKSRERILKLEILANEGNFKHNVKVIKKGVGEIVVARRWESEDNEPRSPKDFMPCKYCLKFVRHCHLWSHDHNVKFENIMGS